jgi:hypothetical protein
MKPLLSAVGVVVSVVFATSSCAQETDKATSGEYPYSPAFVDSHPRVMHIFRFSGGEEEPALPADLAPVIYAPDGKSLYGFQSRTRPGLLKLDLDTMKLSVVPGSTGLPGAAGVAISPDEQRIILSGNYDIGGSTTCGLFELRPTTGNLSLLVENSDCGPEKGLSMWMDLSLSADGERVVVRSRSGMRIIDLVKRTITPLSEEYAAGAWSPDGRWLSVVEAVGQQRTILLDAKTLKGERTLGNSTARWSPDSRYLLALAPDSCGPYWFTFQVLDVATGQRLAVSGSRCKVNLNTEGWVRPKGRRPEPHP